MLEDKENQQYAAIAIRTAYCHGLETLFAFICATIQAPDCVVGWLQKYEPKHVRKLVKDISSGNTSILTKLTCDHLSWHELAKRINIVPVEDLELADKIGNSFGLLWSRFAKDFLDENIRIEYNHIKHGFRVNPGGFTLSIGFEDEYMAPVPKEKMHNLGGSIFGSTYFLPEPIIRDEQKCTYFRVRRSSINWIPANLISGLELISCSLNNILSFLKIVNGVEKNVVFKYPENEDFYMDPWKCVPGVFSFNADRMINKDDITFITKEEILQDYKEVPTGGIY